MWDPISGPRDHDLSQRRTLNTEPPRKPGRRRQEALGPAGGGSRAGDPGPPALRRRPGGGSRTRVAPAPEGPWDSGNRPRAEAGVDGAANPGALLPAQPIGSPVPWRPPPPPSPRPGRPDPRSEPGFSAAAARRLLPARHAVRRGGHQLARQPCARGAGEAAVRGHCSHPGQARGPRERNGAAGSGHGGERLPRALRAAAHLLHRSGGHRRGEPCPQRPILRVPHQGAGPGPGSDNYPLFPPGALADWQEWDSHDFSMTGTEGTQGMHLSAVCPFQRDLLAE